MSRGAESVLQTLRRPQLGRLQLHDFRSYRDLDQAFSARLIALTGENGAGKTNILEAISLLTAGRGLRRADLNACAHDQGAGGWALSAHFQDQGDTIQLGTGIEPAQNGQAQGRRYRMDRAPISSIRAFADHVRIVWLTPAMDGLFTGQAGDRRRFLDRLVLAVDADHGTRVNGLEKALRNRNRLLEEGARDPLWLDAAEKEVAELAIAVAAARAETVARLSSLILSRRDDQSCFPWAQMALTGEVETLVTQRPALEAEETYRQTLRLNRARDAAAGRTLIGPQTSDLLVHHGPKQRPAAQSSTGEQKALLVGLVLAHARLVAEMSGIVPLVLLDEITAHFDPMRRAALFDALEELGGQVWMTGADPQAFGELKAGAQLFRVLPGRMEAL